MCASMYNKEKYKEERVCVNKIKVFLLQASLDL